jgi:hypothetical protein
MVFIADFVCKYYRIVLFNQIFDYVTLGRPNNFPVSYYSPNLYTFVLRNRVSDTSHELEIVLINRNSIFLGYIYIYIYIAIAEDAEIKYSRQATSHQAT